MHEDTPLRQMLVELLADIEGKAATIALAQRAVFDVSPEVRGQAVEALASRPKTDVRPVLTSALRYPFAPVADHAAEALAALRDEEAVPQLVGMLRLPDPSGPQFPKEAVGFSSVPGGKKLTLQDKRRVHIDNVLAKSKGVDVWKDVSAEFLPDGRLKFEGTAYFKNLDDFKGGEMNPGSPVRLVRDAGGQLTMVMVSDPFRFNENKKDKDPPVDPTRLTPAELDEYILQKRSEYQSMRWLFKSDPEPDRRQISPK